jgi:hypothetical protein
MKTWTTMAGLSCAETSVGMIKMADRRAVKILRMAGLLEKFPGIHPVGCTLNGEGDILQATRSDYRVEALDVVVCRGESVIRHKMTQGAG